MTAHMHNMWHGMTLAATVINTGSTVVTLRVCTIVKHYDQPFEAVESVPQDHGGCLHMLDATCPPCTHSMCIVVALKCPTPQKQSQDCFKFHVTLHSKECDTIHPFKGQVALPPRKCPSPRSVILDKISTPIAKVSGVLFLTTFRSIRLVSASA